MSKPPCRGCFSTSDKPRWEPIEFTPSKSLDSAYDDPMPVEEYVDKLTPEPTALAAQVGGGHYKGLAIQPVEYIHRNGIGYFEGNVIKYVSRWRDKGGIEDLRKAKHYMELLIELEENGL